MKWEHWLGAYIETYCVARGLRPKTISAYRDTLKGFREYVRFRLQDCNPEEITSRNVLEYVDYLRRERDNAAAAVNRQVTILKNFYRAMVSMDFLEPRQNPLMHFPKIKAAPRKLPESLSEEEIRKLIANPRTDTILGLRDRAIIMLLYSTGIRVSECADLKGQDIDFDSKTIKIRNGKGGHQRTLPLNSDVLKSLLQYQFARGSRKYEQAFFWSRFKNPMSRAAIYERVRTHAQKAKIKKRVSPHRLRHTFATHLVLAGVDIVTIRDLLGHRQITSTQIYLHVTAEFLREATDKLPIAELVDHIKDLLPGIKIPFQHPPGKKFA